MFTSPMKGRSTTRTTAVSLRARPSLAYSVRSASSGSSRAVATPATTGSVTSRHVAPVRRWASVTSRRPGARTVTEIRSPRSTEAGSESSRTPSKSVPLQARRGCRRAAQPSGAVAVPATSAATPAAAVSIPTPTHWKRRRLSVGASGLRPYSPSLWAIASAPSRPSDPLAATSMVPRMEPSRSERSRSISPATPGRVAMRLRRDVRSRKPPTTRATAAIQRRMGTGRGRESHRAEPRKSAPPASNAPTAPTTRVSPDAFRRRASARRSRSTSSMRLICPVDWLPRTQTGSRPSGARFHGAPADRCRSRGLPTRSPGRSRSCRTTPADSR